MKPEDKITTTLNIPVFFISLSILAAEMVIIRVMSFINSASFASMVISIALLGFGVSGTVITLLRRRIDLYIDRVFFASALAAMLFTSVTLPIAVQLILFPRAFTRTIARYSASAVILFSSSLSSPGRFSSTSLRQAKSGIGRLYFFNLTGSAWGPCYTSADDRVGPSMLMLPVVIFSIIPVLLTMPRTAKGADRCCSDNNFACPFFAAPPLTVSAYKDISYTMKYPDAKVLPRSLHPQDTYRQCKAPCCISR